MSLTDLDDFGVNVISCIKIKEIIASRIKYCFEILFCLRGNDIKLLFHAEEDEEKLYFINLFDFAYFRAEINTASCIIK